MGLASLQPTPLMCSLFSSLSLPCARIWESVLKGCLSILTGREMEVEGVVGGREASFSLSH